MEERKKRKWDIGPEDQSAPNVKPKLDKGSTPEPSPSLGAQDLAELAACKINAMLASQKQVQPKVASPAAPPAAALKTPEELAAAAIKALKSAPSRNSDGEFFKKIEARATQSEIKKETGADVVTRGKYYADTKLATEKDPPLYLHVSAVSQEILDKAINKIEELIQQASVAPQGASSGGYPGHHTPGASTKLYVDFEPDKNFNFRAKVVGPQGRFVKHIQAETGCRVFLKGAGSGYELQSSNADPNEPLHLHITGSSDENVEHAKKLCEDLLNTVKQEYERFKRPPAVPQMPYPGFYPGYPVPSYPGAPPPPPGAGVDSYGAAPPGVESYAAAAYGTGTVAAPGVDAYPGASAAPGTDGSQSHDEYTAYYMQYYAQYYQQASAYQQPPPST